MSNNNNKDYGPDFSQDPILWFHIWRTINWSWEKEWDEIKRSENSDPAYVGNKAGEMFRFRELSGEERRHGCLIAGSGELEKTGRKFQDHELAWRRAGRFSGPKTFSL